MANFDDNPIKPNRDVKRDFKMAVDPPPKPKQPETPELAYKSPEPVGPGLGNAGPTQERGPSAEDAVRDNQRRGTNRSADKSVGSLSAEQARRLITEAFNRCAKDKDNENER